MVRIKRAYESAKPADGHRVLIDRLWPRGLRKNQAHLDEWLKEIAPSDALRKWFGHDPKRWRLFEERYRKELASPAQRERLRMLLAAAGNQPLTLVYGAKDEEHNQAVVLRDVLSRIAA